MRVDSVNYQGNFIRKNYYSPNFGKEYPLYDIMCILSCSLGHNKEGVANTTASLLNKKTPASYLEFIDNLYSVRCKLFKQYPQLVDLSKKFKNELHAINPDYTKLSKSYEELAMNNIAKKFGSNIVDIEI